MSNKKQRFSGRAPILVALGILLSRISGLIRESLLRGALGLGPAADAFAAAIRIPNLLQNLLGEGSLSAAFIPVYSKLLGQGRQEEAGRVAGAVASFLTVLAGGLTIVGILAARPITRLLAPGFEGTRFDLTVELVRITTAGTGFLVLAAWCLGVLNSHRRFFLSYVAPVLWNGAQIAVLGAAIFSSWEAAEAARALAWGLVVGGVLQLGFQVLGVARLRTGVSLSANWKLPTVLEVFRRFVPAVVGRGVLQLSAYLDLVLASLLATGALAGLMSAQALYVLPVSLFALSIASAELPEMSRDPHAPESEARFEIATRRSLFFLAFSTIVYLTLGDLIVGALFGWGSFDSDDTTVVWLILAAYALGLPALGISRVCQSLLYSRGDTIGPARIAVFRMILALAIGVPLMFPLDRLSVVGGSFVGRHSLFDSWGPLEGAIRLTDSAPHLGAIGLAFGSAMAAWIEAGLLVRRAQRSSNCLPNPRSALIQVLPAFLFTGIIALLLRPIVNDLPDLLAAPLTLLATGSTYLLFTYRASAAEAIFLVNKIRNALRL